MNHCTQATNQTMQSQLKHTHRKPLYVTFSSPVLQDLKHHSQYSKLLMSLRQTVNTELPSGHGVAGLRLDRGTSQGLAPWLRPRLALEPGLALGPGLGPGLGLPSRNRSLHTLSFSRYVFTAINMIQCSSGEAGLCALGCVSMCGMRAQYECFCRF